jgi:geranylgeranyl transferase type-2 subunit beta
MLQVARLAPKQLGESRELVAAFLHSRLNSDGGFQNRTGDSDLYYTVFGLEGLVALQEPVPAEAVAFYLRRFDAGEGLDLVHLACLARCWATVSRDLSVIPAGKILDRLETHRARDGGYALSPEARHGNAYACFLALGAYQDLGAQLPDSDRLLAALSDLRAADGGYANQRGDAHGITTVTAAAVSVLRALGGPVDPHLGVWLLDRCHASGGFVATPSTPIPDLLSTATALHALSTLHVPLAGVYEPCLDFVDSLWTNRGGFYGTWVDDTLDCEYTYYGLLALGHLTVAAPA